MALATWGDIWGHTIAYNAHSSAAITYTPHNNQIHLHETTAPAEVKDYDKEQYMAQRHDFTFPYTGQEIADAISRKIQRLTDRVTALHSLDRGALEMLYDIERNTDLSKKVEREVKQQQARVAELVKERAPYAKAGKQSFDLDLEDVEHFGLNDEDTPVKQRRTRKPKETQPVEDVAE